MQKSGWTDTNEVGHGGGTYTAREYNSRTVLGTDGETYLRLKDFSAGEANGGYSKLNEGYSYTVNGQGDYEVDAFWFEPTYHYHKGGLVGGVATLAAGEEFAKLLEGEFVSNPAQMKRFMEDTLPQVAEYGAENAVAVPVAEAQSAQGVVYSITIAPSFTMQGVENDNLEDKFRECGDMVVDMVIDRLEEMGIDAKRGAYV